MLSRPEQTFSRLSSTLTGRFNFRRTFSGKLVLRVEEDVPSRWPWSRGERHKRWRDAGSLDLAAPELRGLVDLRSKHHYPGHRHYELAEIGPSPLVDDFRLPGDPPRPALANGESSWQLHRSAQ